jgi:hypothetical protein
MGEHIKAALIVLAILAAIVAFFTLLPPEVILAGCALGAAAMIYTGVLQLIRVRRP